MFWPWQLLAELHGPQPRGKVVGYFITRALLCFVLGAVGIAWAGMLP